MNIYSKIHTEMNDYFRSPRVNIDNTKRDLFMKLSLLFFFLLMVFKY